MGRDERAEVVLAAEDPVSGMGDEIIDGITQEEWGDRGDRCKSAPAATEVAQDIQGGVGADQKASVGGEDDDAVGQAGAALGRYAGLERFALQGRKVEEVAGPIMPYDEFHDAMA